MRRLLLLITILLLACRVVTPARPTPALIPTNTPIPSVTFTPKPAPTVTPTPAPTLTPTPTPDPAQGYVVQFLPVGHLYAGDLVSMEIIPPPGVDVKDQQVRVTVQTAAGSQELSAGFGRHGIAGRIEAAITWGWDTGRLAAGDYPVSFKVDPGGPSWTQSVSLAPAEAAPPPAPDGQWESVQTECCTLYFISGTDAARDIEDLADTADEQARRATQTLGVTFTENISVTIMSRVIGHGGFAGDQIYITYSDNNYIGSRFDMVLHHEMIHILDGRLGGEWKPSLLVEGLATYETGGHFKPEPLMPRAAALLDLQTDGQLWYIPLRELADQFYASQHEIGYLEGAALIEYLVNQYGWTRFDTFYRSMKAPPDNLPSTALDLGLQANFGITLAELEEDFQSALRAVEVREADREDMRLTVLFYDTVRRYQQMLDPSAYFATAWLPDANEMRRRGIIADLTRTLEDSLNLQIEALLREGAAGLESGNYPQVDQNQALVNGLLDAAEHDEAGWVKNNRAGSTPALLWLSGIRNYGQPENRNGT